MNLYSHNPYWLMKDGIVTTYPSLDRNLSVDVAIMGAGVSAALVAYYLRNSGLAIAVFDRRHAGMGSTAASTAFLQYEIDTPMTELVKYVGEENAMKSYQLCRKAIYDIAKIANALKPALDFHIRPSLQYASYKKHRDKLFNEYQLRLKHGFAVKWLEPRDIKNDFGFEAPGAIFSKDGGEVDAYLLTHALLRSFTRAGQQVFNNTHISNIAYGRNKISLYTDTGLVVKAKKLVIACGYESLKYVPKKIADIYSTYALVSEPVDKKYLWRQNSLIWETAIPYMYFRAVDGNRIMIGGKDDLFHDPHIRDSRIKRKTAMLLHSFSQKMKNISVKADFSWAGAFAVTKDGLPYIGSIPERPDTFFALGFGGNGITFSAVAAEMLRNSLLNRKNEYAGLFSFNR